MGGGIPTTKNQRGKKKPSRSKQEIVKCQRVRREREDVKQQKEREREERKELMSIIPKQNVSKKKKRETKKSIKKESKEFPYPNHIRCRTMVLGI